MTSKQTTFQLNFVAKGDKELKTIAKTMDSVKKQMKGVRKETKNLSQGMNQLRGAMVGFFGVLSVREIAQFSDGIQLLDDRIKLFANSGETSRDILDQLNQVARETNGDIIGLGEAFSRIALNVNDLGLSTKQVVDITQALQQSFRISGSTTAEANAAIIQLTQGFAQGEVRGQELRSVLEANGVIAGLLADEFGVARGQLIKLGEAGKITADRVIKVLTNNLEDLNKQAENLRPTFEQGVIKLLNEFRLRILDLNKEIGASSKFNQGIEILIDNLGTLTGVLVGLGGTAVVGAVGALASAFGPVVAAVAATSAAVGGLVGALSDARNQETDKLVDLSTVTEEAGALEDRLKAINDRIKELQSGPGTVFSDDDITKLQKARMEIEATLDPYNSLSRIARETSQGIIEGADQEEKATVKKKKNLSELAKINQQFANGEITRLQGLMKLRDLEIKEIQRKRELGTISFEEEKDQVAKINEQYQKKIDAINRSGTALESVQDGVKAYADSVGTLSENISGFVKGTFDRMGDALAGFITKGKIDFKAFSDAIFADLARIAARQAIVSAFGGAFADGAAFSNGSVIPFANGGVVSSPTFFPMSGGRTGLMGEAGPEAIMPLTRDGSGSLGVKASGMGSNVMVNIVNQAGGEVETSERRGPNDERILDITIRKKIKETFNSGEMDRTMRQNYGVNRRGY